MTNRTRAQEYQTNYELMMDSDNTYESVTMCLSIWHKVFDTTIQLQIVTEGKILDIKRYVAKLQNRMKDNEATVKEELSELKKTDKSLTMDIVSAKARNDPRVKDVAEEIESMLDEIPKLELKSKQYEGRVKTLAGMQKNLLALQRAYYEERMSSSTMDDDD